MYKLKVNKGTRVVISWLGITLIGDREYTQEELKNLYNLGLTDFIEKEIKVRTKRKTNVKNTSN